MNTKGKILCAAVVAASMVIGACKPTPRTANDHSHQQEKSAAQPNPEQHSVPTNVPSASQKSAGLLRVDAVSRAYNPLRPWEMGEDQTSTSMGVYLGQGRVLTTAGKLPTATYVELSLPDKTQAVPARVQKVDADLGLALLTVQHEKDATLFDAVRAHEVGSPMQLGDVAQLHSLINDVTPVYAPVKAESANTQEMQVPLITMRALSPLPQALIQGLPVLKDGRIVGMVMSHRTSEQSLSVVNAELIQRFLLQAADAAGVPVLGGQFIALNDPVFRKYLKLDPKQGGLYVSKVEPMGALAAAGVRAGDVLVSVEGEELDAVGNCKHPIYGVINVSDMIRSLKPCGEKLTLGMMRHGEAYSATVALNRDAVEKTPLRREKAGTAPRYIMWGGLLFQPLTADYLNMLEQRAGSLPLSFVRVREGEKKLIEQGIQEPVALTFVVPTPATLGYDTLGFCRVTHVNGVEIQSFKHFADLLDAPTPDGTVSLAIDRAPYTIYLDRKVVEESNDALRRRAIHTLRRISVEPHAVGGSDSEKL